jgi:hypothetical protein
LRHQRFEPLDADQFAGKPSAKLCWGANFSTFFRENAPIEPAAAFETFAVAEMS